MERRRARVRIKKGSEKARRHCTLMGEWPIIRGPNTNGSGNPGRMKWCRGRISTLVVICHTRRSPSHVLAVSPPQSRPATVGERMTPVPFEWSQRCESCSVWDLVRFICDHLPLPTCVPVSVSVPGLALGASTCGRTHTASNTTEIATKMPRRNDGSRHSRCCLRLYSAPIAIPTDPHAATVTHPVLKATTRVTATGNLGERGTAHNISSVATSIPIPLPIRAPITVDAVIPRAQRPTSIPPRRPASANGGTNVKCAVKLLRASGPTKVSYATSQHQMATCDPIQPNIGPERKGGHPTERKGGQAKRGTSHLISKRKGGHPILFRSEKGDIPSYFGNRAKRGTSPLISGTNKRDRFFFLPHGKRSCPVCCRPFSESTAGWHHT